MIIFLYALTVFVKHPLNIKNISLSSVWELEVWSRSRQNSNGETDPINGLEVWKMEGWDLRAWETQLGTVLQCQTHTAKIYHLIQNGKNICKAKPPTTQTLSIKSGSEPVTIQMLQTSASRPLTINSKKYKEQHLGSTSDCYYKLPPPRWIRGPRLFPICIRFVLLLRVWLSEFPRQVISIAPPNRLFVFTR